MADFMQIRVEVARAEGAGAARVEVNTSDLIELLATLDPKPKAERRVNRRGTPEDEKCARLLFGMVINVSNKVKEPKSWLAWADDVRLMREQDKRTHEEIRELFQWANNDGFWRANILSPANLRKHWVKLDAQRGMRKPADSKFVFANADRSGDAKAAAASAKRHGIVVPAGEIEF